MEKLRYYLGHNRGLEMLESANGSLRTTGTYFEEGTLEDLKGIPGKPEVVFAAVAFDGGYRSRDAGKTWQKVLDHDVRTFTVDPHDERVIYAGIGPVGLLRSEDEGTTWEPLDGMLDFPPEVKKKWDVPPPYRGREEAHLRHIFVHPDDERLLFVLIEHGGVLRSADRGKTWEDRSDGIDYVDMHMIANYPGSKDRYYVSSAQGFYRSDDSGRHWYRVEKGMPWADKPAWCYSHEWQFLNGDGRPRMVVCGSRGSPGVWGLDRSNPDGHILVSDNGGDDWRVVTSGLERWVPWVLAPHPTDGKTLFCGMGNGARGYFVNTKATGEGALYVSRDAGESWNPLVPQMPSVLTAWVAPA
jgi:photosystem II stability/assembly factor-like uncharacterized protein